MCYALTSCWSAGAERGQAPDGDPLAALFNPDFESAVAFDELPQQQSSGERRRLQAQWDEELEELLPRAPSGCEDPRAANVGAAASCRYECSDLQAYYAPPQQPQVSRCFVFDESTMSWPAELLDLRSQRMDWDVFLDSEEGGTSAAPLTFTIGGGPGCTNVTVRTTNMMTGVESEVTECLIDGLHEHNHVVTDPHTVEVVVYNSSGTSPPSPSPPPSSAIFTR